jgi:hypothetical protein
MCQLHELWLDVVVCLCRGTDGTGAGSVRSEVTLVSEVLNQYGEDGTVLSGCPAQLVT